MLNRSPARVFALCLVLVSLSSVVSANPFPPEWSDGNGAAIHYAPIAWPSEPVNAADCNETCGDWKPYTRFQNELADARNQDPSNGGTSPQSYVNVSSSCDDKTQPSVYYYLHQGATEADDVLMFRWRVEAAAHNYATGPSAGNFGSTNPWSSALWTVFFDVEGSGFRSLAAHLDGSSGGPAEAIDMLAGVWGESASHSLDYETDPAVHLLGHNPTAFVGPTGKLMNFQGSLTPTESWPNGAAETQWDYGTTRARLVSKNSCTEYFVDYQIPIAMLDASGIGGPRITRATPIAMMFCTANSLNNPLQKDCAIAKEWLAGTAKAAPFGDYLSFNQTEPYRQPIIADIEATAPATCPGSYALSARVQDTLALQNGVVIPSVQAVDFYYWYDADGDGEATAADVGSSWVRIPQTGVLASGTLNRWTASWDSTGLAKGKYLVAAQALDDNTLVDDGMVPSGINNRTFSYLAGDAANAIYIDGAWQTGQAAVFPTHSPVMTPSGTENWYGNPAVTGNQIAVVGTAINVCGVAPTIALTADKSEAGAGDFVGFSITISNPANNSGSVQVSEISNELPDGFSYLNGSTTGATTSDPVINGQQLQWSLLSPFTLAPGDTVTLLFDSSASTVSGIYNDNAAAVTSFGVLNAEPVTIAVDGVRAALSITPDQYSVAADGVDEITFTVGYANDSALGIYSADISTVLPADTVFVACAGGVSCSESGGTVQWTLDEVPAGASGTVSFTITVSNTWATTSLQASASFAGEDGNTNPVTATASTRVAVSGLSVATPAGFVLSKTASDIQVAPGGTITYTIAYENYGGTAATSVVITDTLPDGMAFVSCTNTCAINSGVATWNIGTVAAGASGSVTITVLADTPFLAPNPATNAASVDWNGGTTVAAMADVGITGQACNDYYFSDTTGDVGVDGVERLAVLTPVPTAASTGASVTVTAPGSGTGAYIEALRFYQDPATQSDVPFAGNISTRIYIDRANGPAMNLRTTVYDYNSSTGALVQLGQQLDSFTGSSKGLLSVTVPTTGTLSKDHRLLWVFEAQSNHNANTFPVQFQYGGSVTNAISGGTTVALSGASFCVTPPANILLTSTPSTSQISAASTETIAYTLEYGNSGSVNATSTVLLATLPAGFTGCEYSTDNSSWLACSNMAGQAHSFALGTLNGGSSGTVYLRGSAPAGSLGGDTLTQSNTISSDQTSSKTASSDVVVTDNGGGGGGSPDLAIDLRASVTGIVPGDSVVYSATVINIGSAAASNVVITNVVPAADYYSYQACSDSCGVAGNTLSWNIGSLAAGEARTVTYTMQAGSTNLAAGVTTIDDALAASGDGIGAVNSNTVTVSLSGMPVLALVATATPDTGLAPGDTFRYSVTVTNTGSVAATAVQLTDPIPAITAYAGNLVSSTGIASFDAVNNRVRFAAGDLAPAASATLAFDVQVGALPSGNTTLSNVVTGSASNAATASASVDAQASATAALTVTQTHEGTSAYPAATVTATSSGTDVRVDNPQHFQLGQAVQINSLVYTVTGVSSDRISVNNPVSVTVGDSVIASLRLNIGYRHTGNAVAVNAVLSELLPAGLRYYSASPAADVAPAVGSSGTLEWILGDVAVGASGNLDVIVFPSGVTGALTATATITADNTASDSASTTVNIGGLRIGKSTTTPTLSAGDSATYTITLTNSLSVQVSNVTVTDQLPSGFHYATGSATVGGAPVEPQFSVDDITYQQPAWNNLTVPANDILVIEFVASIDAEVGAGVYQNEVQLSAPAGIGIQLFDPLTSLDEDVTVLAADEGLLSGYVFHRDGASGTAYVPGSDQPLANVRVEIYQSGADCNDLYDPGCVILYTDSDGAFARALSAGDWSINVVSGTGELTDPGWVQLVGNNDVPVTIAAQATWIDHNGFGVLSTTSDVTDISKQIDEDSSLTFTLTDFSDQFTDSQSGSNLQQVRIDSLPGNGTLTLNGNPVSIGDEIPAAELGNLVYTPEANYSGADSFEWNATDGLAYDSSSALVNITVNPVADPEDSTISDISKTLPEDTDVSFSAADFAAVLNDSAGGSNLEYVRIESLPAHGALTLDGNPVAENAEISALDLERLVYTPEPGYSGTDSFQWNAFDGAVYAAVSAQVNLTITAVADPGTITDVNRSANEDSAIKFTPADFLAVFTDANGGKNLESIRIDTLPDHGTLTLNGVPVQAGDSISAADLANLVYTPDPGFSGTDSFEWNAFDGDSYAASPALVNLLILPTNDAPVAPNDEVTTPVGQDISVDVISDAFDPDGDTMTLVSATSNFGHVEIVNNQLVFTPDPQFSGVVEITFVITDGNGGYSKGTVIVNVVGDGNEPTLTVPADIAIDANALYTKVDLGVATAEDRFGNPLPVSLVDGITFFEPGLNRAFWETVDADGNRRVEMQIVRVRPLVSIDKDKIALEGRSVRVGVYLNGLAPAYPLSIPYSVSGSADVGDHTLVDGTLVIESGTEGYIQFDSVDDGAGDDGETVVITLDAGLNRGNTHVHQTTLAEGNVAPDVGIVVRQNGVQRLLISRAEGLVTLRADVADPNVDDSHNYVWQWLLGSATDLDTVDDYFTFDPLQLSVGLYVVEVTVSDDGSPSLEDTARIYLSVVEMVDPPLPGNDSDLDLIPDDLEGTGDDDGDGVPNYLDSRAECNVALEQVNDQDGFQIEGEPGVCLRRGYFTAHGESGGALLTESDIVNGLNQIIPDPDAINVGGIFDYISYGLPQAGQTYRIVMPQRMPVPDLAVYRKFINGSWGFFTEGGSDQIASAPGEQGFCPPPGGSSWQPGLTAGHWCVQLTISDGGPNDADGMANGIVVDPGGVGVLISANLPPVATNLSARTTPATAVRLDILSGASDPDDDTLNVTSASVNIGSLVINGDNSITYTPPAGFIGQALIIFSVSDGNGGTAVARATVDIEWVAAPVDPADDTTRLRTKGGGGATSVWLLLTLALFLSVRTAPTATRSVLLRRLPLLGAVLAILAGSATAQPQNDDVEHPWYLKGTLGLSMSGASTRDIEQQFDAAGLDARVVSFDDSDIGYGLALGYQFDEHWSVEAGYLDLGQFAIEIEGNYSDPEAFYDDVEELHPEAAQGVQLSGHYRWFLTDQWALQAQLGVFIWEGDYDTTVSGVGRVGDNQQNETSFFAGVGVGYRWRPRWYLHAGWERYRFENHDVDFLNAGVSWRFGGKHRAVTAPVAAPVQPPAVQQAVEPQAISVAVAPVVSAAACKLFDGALEGVNFESGSATLTAGARQALQQVANTLQDVPQMAVVIQAHTDDVGAVDANQRLSEARAQSVRMFLIEQGVAEQRLTAVGFGESTPIADNRTREGRAANRRVEFRQQPSEPSAGEAQANCP